MTTPALRRDGELHIVDFGDHENRTDLDWIASMHALLDEVEAADGPSVLVTTGSGKHYSNGLDVDWMAGRSGREIVEYVNGVEGVLARILAFPAPTVAAVNGHAFGAGAFALIAHDHVVMRADRGYVCWPEVHLGMTFSRGLMAMVKELLPRSTGWEAIVTGRRYDGAAGLAAGFVDRTAAHDDLLAVAAELGLPHAATAGANLGRIKSQLHADVLAALGTG